MPKLPYKLYEVEKFSTIKEMMELAVKEAGDKVAFKFRRDGQIIDVTYRQFYADTMALGTALASLGVGNRHIAMVGENSYNWITVYLTVLKSSGVYVPIDKELPFSDIMNIVNDGDCEVVFYTKRYEDDFMQHAAEMPKVRYFIGIDREEDFGNFLSFEILMAKGRELYADGDETYASMTSDPNALKMLVYTSGTTGMQKGVMLSEHNLVSSVYYGLQVSTVYTRSLSVLPYNHTYEAVSGLLVSIHKHVTICINDSLKFVLKNLQEYKPDFIYLVPAFVEVFYKKIMANARQNGKEATLKKMIAMSNKLRRVGIDMRKTLFASVHKAFGGNLRKIVCGGSPLRPELGEFFDGIGISLINGYGITECSPLIAVDVYYHSKPGSVGPAVTSCMVRIEDAVTDEDGHDIGEICVKGKNVMLGYYKDEAATADAFTADGWFRTGDLGYLDDEGYIYITGRKKSVIVLENGKNVFPEEIEEYLASVDKIAECVVVGRKNGRETVLTAVVFPNAEKFEADTPESEMLAAVRADVNKLNRRLVGYKQVRNVELRTTPFEKTTSMKIKRHLVK